MRERLRRPQPSDRYVHRRGRAFRCHNEASQFQLRKIQKGTQIFAGAITETLHVGMPAVRSLGSGLWGMRERSVWTWTRFVKIILAPMSLVGPVTRPLEAIERAFEFSNAFQAKRRGPHQASEGTRGLGHIECHNVMFLASKQNQGGAFVQNTHTHGQTHPSPTHRPDLGHNQKSRRGFRNGVASGRAVDFAHCVARKREGIRTWPKASTQKT